MNTFFSRFFVLNVRMMSFLGGCLLFYFPYSPLQNTFSEMRPHLKRLMLRELFVGLFFYLSFYELCFFCL